MTIQLNLLSNQKTSIVLYSGGLGSFCAAWLEIERIGLDNVILYFNDTLVEDEDLYRFLVESVCWFHGKKVSLKLKKLIKSIPDLEQEDARKAHLLTLGKLLDDYCPQFHYDPAGKNIFEVFHEERYLGNTRVDPCSRVLKRERSQAFVSQFTPDQVDVVVGMDWSEIHRIEKAIPHWLPYTLRSPMCPAGDDDTNWQPKELTEKFLLKLSGIKPCRMYAEQFPHSNCSGYCVKAGLAQFKLLYEKRPKVYAYFERKQEELHATIPSTRPFLRKTINGVLTYLTLKEYREQFLEKEIMDESDKFDFGGCACAI